jgi:hypothetical protein
MKINNLNAQYELPGFDIAPKAFEPEEADEDYRDAPYSLDTAPSTIPAPNGWQQLLGLKHTSSTPISIDPPQQPTTGGWKTRATATYQVHRDRSSNTAPSASSINVRKMLAMLTQNRQNIAKIRVRATEGA